MRPSKTSFFASAGPARWNLIFAYASLFCYGLADNIRGPVYPEIVRTLNLTNAEGSWFFALASTLSMTGGAGIALLLRRWSYLRTFHIAIALLFVSQVVFALSSTFAHFLAGAVLFGIAAGFLGVLQNVLVLVTGTGASLARWMSGLHANYGLASLLAPLIVSGIAFVSNDFRAGFWCVAAVTLAMGLASLKVPAFVEPTHANDPLVKKRKISWSLVSMAAVFALYVGAEVLMGTRIAQFTRDAHGSSLSASGAWTSLFFVGLFLGRIVFTFVHLPWPVRSQLGVSLLISVVFGISGLWFSPWFFGLMGLSMGPCYPWAMSLVSEVFRTQLAYATQVCISATSLLLIPMHLVAGELWDHIGSRNALLMGPAGLLLSAIFLTTLKTPGAKRA